MPTNESRPERVDASYRSLRIHWWTRLRLQWSARSDRRAGLPIGLDAASTPVLRDLVTRHDDVCERERAEGCRAIEPIDIRLAHLAEELPALERQLREDASDVKAAEGAYIDAALRTRRAGEQGLPEELVRDRRRRELDGLADAARSRQAQTARRLDAARQETAELQKQRELHIHVARSRALRFGDHTQRLGAIYRRALIRRHPQRDELVKRWNADFCPPPEWVVSDDLLLFPSRPVGADA